MKGGNCMFEFEILVSKLQWVWWPVVGVMELASVVDPDPGSQTKVDLCWSGSGSWSDFKVKKVEFLNEKYIEVSNR